MMSDEKKKSPAFDLKTIPVDGSKVKIILKSAKPRASGTNTFDDGVSKWNMWIGEVTNQPVVDGRGKDAKKIDDYTGEVVLFPTEPLHEQFMEITGGINENVPVELHKEFGENATTGKPYRKYIATKAGEGTSNNSLFTPTETKLLKDAKSLLEQGLDIDEDTFVTASQEDVYDGKINEERARKLFKFLKK